MHGHRGQVHVAAHSVELGPQLKRSNLEYVILQGSQFCRTKWQRAFQRCSRRPGLVPRWTGWRLLLCHYGYFLNTIQVRSQRLEREPTQHSDSMCMARNGRSSLRTAPLRAACSGLLLGAARWGRGCAPKLCGAATPHVVSHGCAPALVAVLSVGFLCLGTVCGAHGGVRVRCVRVGCRWLAAFFARKSANLTAQTPKIFRLARRARGALRRLARKFGLWLRGGRQPRVQKRTLYGTTWCWVPGGRGDVWRKKRKRRVLLPPT